MAVERQTKQRRREVKDKNQQEKMKIMKQQKIDQEMI